MTFEEQVRDFLRLCDAAIREDDGEGLGLDALSAEAQARIKKGPSAEERAMRDFLNGLPEAVVLKVQTLMYCGRDDRWDVDEFQPELDKGKGKADAVRTIMSKVPDAVAKHLRDGLALMRAHAVDLERPWASGA